MTGVQTCALPICTIELNLDPVPDQLTINGKTYQSPDGELNLQHSTGDFAVTAIKEGFETYQDTISVLSNKTTKKSIRLEPILQENAPVPEPGSVELTVVPSPDAIKVGGKPARKNGDTFRLSGLAPGDHSLTIESKTRGNYRTKINIVSGKKTRRTFDLNEHGGTLVVHIRSKGGAPNYGKIYLNNQYTGINRGFWVWQDTLMAGRQSIKVVKNGSSHEHDINIKNNQKHTLIFEIDPATQNITSREE